MKPKKHMWIVITDKRPTGGSDEHTAIIHLTETEQTSRYGNWVPAMLRKVLGEYLLRCGADFSKWKVPTIQSSPYDFGHAN